MAEQEKRLSHLPTPGLSYDPNEERYWQSDALYAEISRVCAICHSCRLCFKYCDAFPLLFRLLDERHGGDARLLSPGEIEEVLDRCFQCKQCEMQCPYTPREGHEYALDFPKLVHRFRALRVRQQGMPRSARLLADPEGLASMARLGGGLSNSMNRVRAVRWLMEKTIGVHRRALLPEFAAEPFELWALRNGKVARAPGCEAVLFPTCFVEHNDPQLGRDTLEVLEHNGVDVQAVAGLCCCGMPAWEHGDLETVRRQAKRNLDLLTPFVERGAQVLVINPTCSMMMRLEHPMLVAAEDRGRALALAAAVRDVNEYTWSLRKARRFKTDFRSTPGSRVAYHAPCHLRAQAIGFKGRDLLRTIPGLQPVMVAECCGHNGTFGMTVAGFEQARRIAEKAIASMRASEATVWATECSLAALQFRQDAGVRALHPMTILARAYRPDGFAERLPEGSAEGQP